MTVVRKALDWLALLGVLLAAGLFVLVVGGLSVMLLLWVVSTP